MARASKIQRGKGGMKSAKAKVGGECSTAMSQWKTSGMTPAIAAILGKCRAKARMQKQGDMARVAGNEAKAQAFEAKAARGLTKGERMAKAKELVAKRKAGQDQTIHVGSINSPGTGITIKGEGGPQRQVKGGQLRGTPGRQYEAQQIRQKRAAAKAQAAPAQPPAARVKQSISDRRHDVLHRAGTVVKFNGRRLTGTGGGSIAGGYQAAAFKDQSGRESVIRRAYLIDKSETKIVKAGTTPDRLARARDLRAQRAAAPSLREQAAKARAAKGNTYQRSRAMFDKAMNISRGLDRKANDVLHDNQGRIRYKNPTKLAEIRSKAAALRARAETVRQRAGRVYRKLNKSTA